MVTSRQSRRHVRRHHQRIQRGRPIEGSQCIERELVSLVTDLAAVAQDLQRRVLSIEENLTAEDAEVRGGNIG